MIELLRGWVLSLAMLSLLAGVADAIMPAGSMKKYVRVALGMVILAQILDPALVMVDRLKSGSGVTLEPFVETSTTFSRGTSRTHTYQAYVEWQVRAMAASVDGVSSVATQVRVSDADGGSPRIAEIVVDLRVDQSSARGGQAIAEALRALLAAYLNVEPDRVIVRARVSREESLWRVSGYRNCHLSFCCWAC